MASIQLEEERALLTDVGAAWIPRDVVLASGPDAASFLQGQVSQDIDALATGGSALAFVLAPQGKVDALVRLTRLADDSFLLDTDGGFGAALLARLQRFKLRVKCDLEAADRRCLAVRGPRAAEVVAGASPGDGTLALPADWPGWDGVDLVGDDPHVPDGVTVCSSDAYEGARIVAGVPRMGAELDERTIPAESGLVDRTVSFTKGCYTGQELVARLDSRGHVNRHLRRVRAGDVDAPVGASIVSGGKEVGTLTSVAPAIPGRGLVALGYVRREVTPPTSVLLRWAEGEAAAEVESLT